MSKLLLATVVTAVGGVVAWWGIGGNIEQMTGILCAESTVTARQVRLIDADVSPAAIEIVRGIGYVEPASEIRRLVFKIDGVIDQMAVEVGQFVHAGEVLAVLQNHDEQADVAEAEQQCELAVAEQQQLLAGVHPEQIIAARRNAELLEELVRFAVKQQRRIDALTARGVATNEQRDQSQSELHQAQKAWQQAQAELANLEQHVRPVDRNVAEAKVQLAEARLTAARQRLANTVMLAPLDGTVLEILKREGEGARVLDPDPVLVMGDESRLHVRAEIDERYVDQLAEGQAAEIYGRGLGSDRYRGTIVLVKRLMGNKTVFSHQANERKDLDVLQVLVELPADFRAPLGLHVDVDIEIDGRIIPPHDDKR
ncbi:MAG: HlyD family secretion protein [Thermomicrobiales bacterium]